VPEKRMNGKQALFTVTMGVVGGLVGLYFQQAYVEEAKVSTAVILTRRGREECG
jgi:hypothetical protein